MVSEKILALQSHVPQEAEHISIARQSLMLPRYIYAYTRTVLTIRDLLITAG